MCGLCSAKDDGAIAVQQDPVLDVPFHRTRQHRTLHVAPRSSAIVYAHGVIDAGDVLFDDRPFIEILSDIVRRRANQFDAAIVRLLVRPRALKARQE
jgi:hypothetical protein